MDQELFEKANAYALQTRKIKQSASFARSRESTSSIVLCDEEGALLCRLLKSDFMEIHRLDSENITSGITKNSTTGPDKLKKFLHNINTTNQGKLLGALGAAFAIGVLAVIFTPKPIRSCSELADDIVFLRDQEFIWQRTAKMPHEGNIKAIMNDRTGIGAGMKSPAASEKAFEIWKDKLAVESEMKKKGCEIPEDDYAN